MHPLIKVIFWGQLNDLSKNYLFSTFIGRIRSPLRDIVVGKIRGEWKKFRVGGKNIFQMFCVLSQNFCVPSRNFAFSRKTFAFSRKDICVPSQRYLRSLAKLLLSLVNIYFFLSFARERKYLCERTQKFCERTQSFSRERKSFARERKTFEKYFFLPPWIFSTHSDFFPPQCPLKGSVEESVFWS